MEPRKKHGWPFWCIIGLIMLPIVCIFAIGPLTLLERHGMVNEQSQVNIRVAYHPLRLRRTKYPKVNDWHNWYTELWAGPPPEVPIYRVEVNHPKNAS